MSFDGLKINWNLFDKVDAQAVIIVVENQPHVIDQYISDAEAEALGYYEAMGRQEARESGAG